MTAGRSNQKSAFTLVELLTVIAIIGILAALLLAVLSRGVGIAKKAYCTNNVRQLGHAMQLFVGDNHVYPLAVNIDFKKGSYPNQFEFWDLTLDHELGNDHDSDELSWKNKGVWKCPSVIRPGNWPAGQNYDSYGYNNFGILGKDAIGPNKLDHWESQGIGTQVGNLSHLTPPVPESEVISPSEMMALGDGFFGNNSFVGGGENVLIRNYDKPPFYWTPKNHQPVTKAVPTWCFATATSNRRR
jgi:prepilin-type N-terminal cleavage/methylation domain-containing protein